MTTRTTPPVAAEDGTQSTDTGRRKQTLCIVATCVLLGAVAALTAITSSRLELFDRADASTLAVTTTAAWLLAAGAVIVLFGVQKRAAVVLVFLGSLAIGGAALAGPPNLSTDSARYAWDGIVQNAGQSPYRYPPSSDHLAELRPTWLYPHPVKGTEGIQSCRGLRIEQTTSKPSGTVLCTALNRPDAPTIYPPVAEAWFAAVRSFVPDSARYAPMQVAGLLLSLGTTSLLVVGMQRRGMDPRWAAIWGWSPFVAAEGVNNSHVDVLGAVLILVATFLAAPVVGGRLARMHRTRPLIVGACIGLAAAVKFVPAVAAPPLLRHAPLRTITAAIGTFVVVYVPYVLLTGWAVIGYLPGYLTEEGYDDGTRFALLASLLPGTSATVVAAALILATAVLAWWRTDADHPWMTQVALIGTVLLIVSPRYEWYALVLVPFIALSHRPEWLAVPLALTARTLFPYSGMAQITVGCAALIVIAVALARWMLHRKRDMRRSPLTPHTRKKP